MADVTPERWLPVVGWEGRYEVSDFGRVWSLWYKNGPRLYPHLLRPWPNAREGGHLLVCLSAPGRSARPYVHQLVAAAFIGPCPPGEEVRHWDGDPANNRRSNLLYGTRAENMEDMVRHGTAPIGSKHGRSVLTEAGVIAIRAAWQEGAAGTDLAAQYGISKAAVSVIVTGRKWQHLPVLPRAPGICACCGVEFERKHRRQIYCARQCKERCRVRRAA
jgi:HNH endonuclease/NUMOD4 motif